MYDCTNLTLVYIALSTLVQKQIYSIATGYLSTYGFIEVECGTLSLLSMFMVNK